MEVFPLDAAVICSEIEFLSTNRSSRRMDLRSQEREQVSALQRKDQHCIQADSLATGRRQTVE